MSREPDWWPDLTQQTEGLLVSFLLLTVSGLLYLYGVEHGSGEALALSVLGVGSGAITAAVHVFVPDDDQEDGQQQEEGAA